MNWVEHCGNLYCKTETSLLRIRASVHSGSRLVDVFLEAFSAAYLWKTIDSISVDIEDLDGKNSAVDELKSFVKYMVS